MAEGPRRRGGPAYGAAPALPRWVYGLRDPGVQAVVVLLAAAAGGFVAIGLSWSGVAARTRAGLQMPFLVSGGFAGVAVAAVALTLVAVHLDRRAAAAERARVDDVVADLAGAGEVLVSLLESRARRPGGREALVVNGVTVHRPDCRFARGRDLPVLGPSAQAGATGAAPRVPLRACRSCQPVI